MRWQVLTAVLMSLPTGLAVGQSRDSAEHPAIVIAPYDPSEDRTVLQVLPFRIDSTLGLSALVALVGHQPASRADGGVVFTLWNTGPSPFTNPPIRLALADSSVLDLGKAWSSPEKAPGYTEVLLASMDIPRFLKLVQSRTAVLYLGNRAYHLSESHMNALRDFASRLGLVANQ